MGNLIMVFPVINCPYFFAKILFLFIGFIYLLKKIVCSCALALNIGFRTISAEFPLGNSATTSHVKSTLRMKIIIDFLC